MAINLDLREDPVQQMNIALGVSGSLGGAIQAYRRNRTEQSIVAELSRGAKEGLPSEQIRLNILKIPDALNHEIGQQVAGIELQLGHEQILRDTGLERYHVSEADKLYNQQRLQTSKASQRRYEAQEQYYRRGRGDTSTQKIERMTSLVEMLGTINTLIFEEESKIEPDPKYLNYLRSNRAWLNEQMQSLTEPDTIGRDLDRNIPDLATLRKIKGRRPEIADYDWKAYEKSQSGVGNKEAIELQQDSDRTMLEEGATEPVDAISGAKPIRAYNPKTQQRIISFDGGRTWQALQQ